MENKKLILALALSIVVLMAWQHFFGPKDPVKKPVVPAEQTVKQDPVKTEKSGNIADIFGKKETEAKVAEAEVKDTVAGTDRDISIETDLYTAVFSSKGAALKSFVLKKYKDDGRLEKDEKTKEEKRGKKKPLDLVSEKTAKYGILPFHFSPFEGAEWITEANKYLYATESPEVMNVTGSNGSTALKFRYADPSKGIEIEKTFSFAKDSYVVRLDSKVVVNGKVVRNVPFVFGPDLESDTDQTSRAMQQVLSVTGFKNGERESVELPAVDVEAADGAEGVSKAKGTVSGVFDWVAYHTTYFAAVFGNSSGKIGNTDYNVIKIAEDGEEAKFYSFVSVKNANMVYLGPKDEDILEATGIQYGFKMMDEVVDYGWFGIIAKPMLAGINFVHQSILGGGNYGWAIVLFTIFLKIGLFPLTYSSSVSMAKMQTLQPKMKAIKKKYRNQKDPEQRKQMNVEMMELYKKEKVNPAGGCLPLFIQMPILFGLFRLLAVSISVRHEPWLLWITDLSMKDSFYVLPVLMGLSQLVVQKMTPSGGDNAQKKMMYIMPVFMTFIVVNFASGLTLYWFVSNLLQIGQQKIINTRIYSQKKEEDRLRKANKRKKSKAGQNSEKGQ